MAKNSLPTYAIVELLIRLANHNDLIGSYKDHAVYDNDVIIKTSGGTIVLPQKLIIKQFESPESITEAELRTAAKAFKPTE